MLNNYFIKKSLSLGIITLLSTFGFSQTPKQIKEITKDYDFEKLAALKQEYKIKSLREKRQAIKLAEQNDWKVKYTDEKGTTYELMRVYNGSPIYYKTYNSTAALATRANYMHEWGGLGLNVEGQGMTAYIWDAGLARATHVEYDGPGGTDRYSSGDGTTATHSHGAHVTGTIMAYGASSLAKGMAPQTQGIGHDWNSDSSEALNATTNGMLLSNHSYGYDPNQITPANDWIFGAYDGNSRVWDIIMSNAPYYLMVIAAGNDGTNNFANGTPLEGNTSYDKLSGRAISKNSMVVGSVNDPSINGDGSLASATRSSFSSEGPTDDLRVKPDIMGNGVSVTSTGSTNDINYYSTQGTSMASPNVCGSLLLLQQHYNNVNGVFIRAATLKGLALHTADDLTVTGPDANTGWGLMNTKAAAETIINNGLQSWVSEEELSQGETFTMTVQSDGTNPLLASISWTDLPGTANTGTFNDQTPVLINDLDIRVSQGGTTYEPWRLTGVTTNGTGDNSVDPYERVDVTGASGTYTITVTHKGTLTDGPQRFSLILTGLSSDFTLATLNSDLIVCSSSDADYNFDYQQVGGGATTFSAANLPGSATATFTPSSLNTNGSFTATFGNLTSVTAGNYEIDVIGDNGSETEIRKVNLQVYHADFTAYPQPLTSPANGTIGLFSNTTLSWPANNNAEDYLVEVATDPAFNTIIASSTETDLEYTVSGLTSETVYYWRVRPNNRCANGNYSQVYNFQVASINCGNVFTATDFSDGNILTTANDTASAPVTVNTSGLNIDAITASLQINHTWVNDLDIALESPTATGNTQVKLFLSSCTTDTGGGSNNPGDGDNFDVTFSDSGATLYCDDAADPSISGTYLPVENLSGFNGLAADGIWTLRVLDPWNGDGGDITAFSVNICTSAAIPNNLNFTNNAITVNANSTYTVVSGDIEATTASETAAQQTYTITALPTQGNIELNGSAMAIGDTFTQDDVNTGNITYTNAQVAAFSDQFMVDIINNANGWLPNQIININATLGINDFELGNVSIFPNPADNTLNIRINSSTGDDVSVSLFDIQGRKVLTQDFTSNTASFDAAIHVNNLASGIYVLDLQQGNKKATKKIMIN